MSYSVDFQSGGVETSPTIPGKTTIDLPQGVVDSTSTSLSLTGKGVANYGEIQQENFIHLLENFASKNQPSHPTIGQLWYDTSTTSLKVYSLDSTWKSVGVSASTSTPVAPLEGQIWYNTTTDVLMVYNGSAWVPVGNTTVGAATQTELNKKVNLAGDTMTGPLILNANPTATLGAATKGYVDSVSATAASKVSLSGDTMTGPLILNANPTAALGAATKGYVDSADATKVPLAGGTMTGSLILNANPTAALGAATKGYVDSASISGNAATATKLASPTTINGVSFDGSAPITVADSTKVPLAGGTMTGSLILNAAPSAVLGAATKGYVDSAAATKVNLAGDTMTGPLILNAAPSSALGAATKGYVDSASISGNAATATKLQTARTINGVGFDGTSDITISTADSTKVPLAGGTMTGPLILNANPTAALGAATKGYIDSTLDARIPAPTLIANGYVNLGGFIIQWGMLPEQPDIGWYEVNFPIVFPTICTGVFSSYADGVNTSGDYRGSGLIGNGSALIPMDGSNTYWMALGY